MKNANNELALDYSKAYKDSEGYRKEVYEARQAVTEKLKDKYNNAKGFWIDFYKKLDAQKK